MIDELFVRLQSQLSIHLAMYALPTRRQLTILTTLTILLLW